VLGIADLASQLGLGRSATHRYCTTLLQLGYLEQDRSRKYRLGIRPTDIGLSALDSIRLRRDSLRQHLDELRKGTGYSVGLGVLDGEHVVYVHHLPSHLRGQAIAGPNIQAGVRVPAQCTSLGKALLAFLPDSDRERVVREGKHERRTEHTITARGLLREQLRAVADLGYAVSDQELHLGARSLAVPVRGEEQEVVAAVNISVYDCALSVHEIVEQLYPVLGATAEQLSEVISV
jgi:IclR family pca regulon transcriptional regulator